VIPICKYPDFLFFYPEILGNYFNLESVFDI